MTDLLHEWGVIPVDNIALTEVCSRVQHLQSPGWPGRLAMSTVWRVFECVLGSLAVCMQ